MNFIGKTLLITGGASGIGKIMARKSLERGAKKIIIWDINPEALEFVKNSFSKLGLVETYIVDISNLDHIKTVANQTIAENPKIDILINNAGVVTGKYFHEHTHEEIDKTMLINSQAVMHISLIFLKIMMSENSGSICTIASSAGLISNPKMSVYAASKWAAIGWSDSLRLEMKQLGKNIHFTTIIPFYINTGMFDGVKSKLLPILDPEKTAERIICAIEKKTKMLAMPLPYWFIRLSQGLLPLSAFDWVMDNVFGIYSTMKNFKGRS